MLSRAWVLLLAASQYITWRIKIDPYFVDVDGWMDV